MAFGLVISVLTDYRISLAKIIPIEAHETLDYLLGGAIVAMPFVVGYFTRVPQVAVLHLVAGSLSDRRSTVRRLCLVPFRSRVSGHNDSDDNLPPHTARNCAFSRNPLPAPTKKFP